MANEITANDWLSPNDRMYTMPEPVPTVDDKNTPTIGPGDDPAAQQFEQPLPEPEPQPLPAPVVEADDDPIVIQNPDGSSISIEKSSKGWKGSVDIGTGSTQVYYGKTKNELLTNVLTAQANATKKIREQNRQIKFGGPDALQPPVQKMDTAAPRKLTADELIEMKLLQETDPEAFFDKMFAIKAGKPLAELMADNEKGKQASLELGMEAAAKTFVARNPDYYADPNFENYQNILAFLSKTKLRRSMTKDNAKEIEHLLVANGFFTAQNLEEAYTDLKEDGLLLSAPPPQRITVVEPPVPPQPTEPRIVRTETRPRAGYGIPQSETTQIRPEATKPPSDIDYNSLSNAELDKLIAAAMQEELKKRKQR